MDFVDVDVLKDSLEATLWRPIVQYDARLGELFVHIQGELQSDTLRLWHVDGMLVFWMCVYVRGIMI